MLYKKIKMLEIKSHQLRNVATIHPDWEMSNNIREEEIKLYKKYLFFKQLQKAICENGKSNRTLFH